jgi:hypothetical protein
MSTSPEDSPPGKQRKASMRCIPGLHTPSPAIESKRRVPSSASRFPSQHRESGENELSLLPIRRTLMLTDAVQNTDDDDLPLVSFNQYRMLTNEVDAAELQPEQQSPSSDSSSQQGGDAIASSSASQSQSDDAPVQRESFKHLMLQAVEDNDGVSVSGSDNSQDDRHLPNLSYVTDGSHTDGEQELYIASLNSQASQLGFGTPLHHRRRERFR